MTDRSIDKRYIPATSPRSCGDELVWMLVFNSNKILVKDLEYPGVPTSEDFKKLELSFISKQYMGELDGYACYCMEVDDKVDAPAGMVFKDLRALLGLVEEELFLLMGRAFQIVNWQRMNKFCGKCGSVTGSKHNELAKVCPCCNSIYYPRISPAVIVAVVREEKILLAHNKNFRPNWYSVIAGFVEPGETFEDCVIREVKEEVGIQVKNVQYFGSQPWPFPDSLMVGFIAEYESGEIIVDGEEIDAAAWYGGDNLPQRPTNDTIAGRLIEAVLSR
ncbi:MAG: nudC 2 [Sporomusa sp.]|jgi:NAD+ diphosphatase|nr:nudC 2 [Sporomusa sp.]